MEGEMRFRDRVILVTGGGSGIGAAACQTFAREGARVAVVGRTLAKAESVASAIREAGGKALAIKADVSLAHDVARMVEITESQLGPPSVLLHCAGISPSGAVDEISEADWDACLDINLKSAFLCARAVIPVMRSAGGGCILNCAGTFGIRAAKQKAAYSTAKAGLINLTRAIALDYARERIRCNAICPGYVDTPLNDGFPLDQRDAFLAQYQPLPGLISAAEVAELALYLASDAAKMITGQAFVIDGGQQAGLFA